MYKDIDIYSELYLKYKNYISSNSIFDPNIKKKTPQSLTKFPTIIMKETLNVNNSITTNRQEFVDDLSFTIEIYTKDISITTGSQEEAQTTLYASDKVMRELQYLTFEFFKNMNCIRETCDDAEYTDITVDRKVIIFSCKISNWNRKII